MGVPFKGQHSESFADAIQGVLNIDTDVGPDVQVGMEELFRDAEEHGESMSVSNPPSYNTSATKQMKSKERKNNVQSEELFVSAVDKFTEMTWSTMSDLVKCVVLCMTL